VLAAQLNGAVLTSGIYSFTGGAADLAAGGTLTLNGPGVFVFNVTSTLTANVGSNVLGSATPCNVFWRVGSSATLNGSSFRGTVIANANVTVGAGSNLNGKAIAGTGATGAVTMSGSGGNSVGGCATVFAPAVGLAGMSGLVALLFGAGALAMRRRTTHAQYPGRW
jgi:ice-binding like protein